MGLAIPTEEASGVFKHLARDPAVTHLTMASNSYAHSFVIIYNNISFKHTLFAKTML